MCVRGRVCRKMILTYLITNQLNAGDRSNFKTCGKKKSMTLLTKHARGKIGVFLCSEAAWKITLKKNIITKSPSSQDAARRC